MGANHAYACDAFGAIVVIIYGNVNGVALPVNFKREFSILSGCKIFHFIAVPVCGLANIVTIRCPAIACVTFAGETAVNLR